MQQFNLSESNPVLLTPEILKRMNWRDEAGGWGGSTGCDYVFSKQVGKIKLEIRTVDYDKFWHITNFDKWALKVEYLHELQFLFYLIFREILEESISKCIRNGYKPKAIWYDFKTDMFFTVTNNVDFSESMMLIKKF